ncbi:fumarylacetoacetate hydrolase family protein [Paraburkholderia sp. BL25I1N1]|uniref:fumarylacetoacetate hydrolase family protein n=1 Tax=Paraburkholderia sp. BL25I1N1 TaxID=1938804 RepID=UPI0015E5FB19|nr:fumarylacetoacetate hydrolase family protein [Paraburkholderia sp. BL25I1N1]
MSIAGVARFVAITDNGFVELGSHFEGRCDCLADLFRDDLLAEAKDIVAYAADTVPLGTMRYLPALPDDKCRVIAIGWAYADHQLETGRAAPEFPSFFFKIHEAFVGHGEPLSKPHVSDRFDFEGEVALVIGKGGRDIPLDQGRSHIGGYTILMDGSVRDWQKHSIPAGKNFASSSSIGPWITTADEIDDPAGMLLTTYLNGKLMQQSEFGQMAWDLGYLVHYLSNIFPLRPGDIISTGTPAGVGQKRQPPVFMAAGDVLEVGVEGIGVLRNPIE